jgi:hypothetical protein
VELLVEYDVIHVISLHKAVPTVLLKLVIDGDVRTTGRACEGERKRKKERKKR